MLQLVSTHQGRKSSLIGWNWWNREGRVLRLVGCYKWKYLATFVAMIGVAIRSLSEEGGSTVESISRFIRSNYDGIPWGHDRLLPYYLNKLTAVAELDRVTPGRYVIIQEQFQEEEEEEELHDEEESDLEEGWPIHCEGDLVKWVEALPTSPTGPKPTDEVRDSPQIPSKEKSYQKKPKRRGRPLKKLRPTEAIGPIDGLSTSTIAHEPMDLQVDNVEIKEGGEPQGQHKRRGKPPKKKQKQQKTAAVGPTESDRLDGLSLISSQPMGLINDGVASNKCPQEKLVEISKPHAKLKKRGRPPKKLQHKGLSEGTGGDGSSAISSEPMGLKGNTDESNNDGKNIVPEPLGRPFKSRPSMIRDSTVGLEIAKKAGDGSGKRVGEVEPAATPPETSCKRRGRPPKLKPQVLES